MMTTYRPQSRPQPRVQPPSSSPSERLHDIPEEVLVIDRRTEIRPAQMVEQKLIRMLERDAFPVSALRLLTGWLPGRKHC